MKKFYAIISLLLVGALTFSLNAANIILNIDNPERINLEVNGEPWGGALVAGDNYIQSFSVKISAKEGYILESVDWENGSYDLPVSNNSVYFGTFTEGAKYYVHTKDANEARSSVVVLDVDKAVAVHVSVDETGRDIELVDGINNIEYDPEMEKTLKIYSSVTTQMPLYSVTVEGGSSSSLSKIGNVYFLSLPCQGTVKIQSQYPEKDCAVTFDYSEGAEGFVTKVTRDTTTGEEIDFSSGSFTVNAGTVLYIYGNEEDYSLSSYEVNGSAMTFGSPMRLIVLDEDVTIRIVAAKFPEFTITINVNEPSFITARYGSTMYPGEIFELVAGSNTVTLNSNKNSILFDSSDRSKYRIASASLNKVPFGEDDYAYDGKLQVPDLKKGDQIDIVMEEISRDLEAVVYLDNAEANNRTLTSALGLAYTLSTGYNHIIFCANDSPFKLSADAQNEAYVYINDEDVLVAGDGTYRFTMTSGSVVKIFVDSEGEPDFYTLTFSQDGFNNVKIVADEIRTVTQRAGYEYLVGTKIEISPKDGITLKVKLDGTELTADAKGVYSFSVSANHNIELKTEGEVGVANINVNTPTEHVIFNLQGIRVDSAELPAGLYIVNGKKTLIK